MAGTAPVSASAAANARYERRLRTMTTAALAKERHRIARELHDGVIQSLYGIGMVLEGIKTDTFQPVINDQLTGITDSINGIIDDVRAYINDLTPARLAKRGLGPELCSLANELHTSTGVIAAVRLHDGTEEINAAMGRDLVQITREALSNVAQHAGATHVVLSLRRTSQNVRLEIADDGCGIGSSRSPSGRGLANIVRRAEAWGGIAEIGIPRGGGTVVRVLLPATADTTPRPGALAAAG
jgi:signal transduction histidine kinase